MDYHVSDRVCTLCMQDVLLRKFVRQTGSPARCILCQKTNITVTIKELAGIIDPFFRMHFTQGDWESEWDGISDSGRSTSFQDGQTLGEVLQSMVGYFPFEDSLIGALISSYRQDPGEPFEPFYGDDVRYMPILDGQGNLSKKWDQIESRIKFRRRYFDVDVKQFFEGVFSGLNRMTGLDIRTNKQSTVVQPVPPGTKFWRGRRCGSYKQLQEFLKEPASKLGPPPSALAPAGRMNAEGISVFYGSRESDTCAAEMRPSIGEEVLTAEFETNRGLLILNFPMLDESDLPHPSYFEEEFSKKMDKRNFIRKLHRLISKPVIPGSERNYLITQALAEYLAHVHDPKIDGLFFSSVQQEGGENVVLFLREKEDADPSSTDEFDLPIRLTKTEPLLVSTKKLNYEFETITFMDLGDGQILRIEDALGG
jgi:hypothetical protein